MELIHHVDAVRKRLDPLRAEGKRIALVPTMGALHDGHLALVREARRLADVVVVSIFVNPTQFGPGEDYERYPRPLDADLHRLEALPGVRFVFAPTVNEMYPGAAGAREPISLVVDQLDDALCGRHRKGHFDGVTTVVAKLFNIVRPHVAVFGLKDAQQFVILKRMAHDLFFDVDVVGVPTVREEDGLAMSSRNVYLTESEREQAVVLSRTVAQAVSRVRKGEQRVSGIVTAMLETMAGAADARVQYAEVVDAETLQPIERIQPSQNILVAVAAFLGETRLIDSAFITAPAHIRNVASEA